MTKSKKKTNTNSRPGISEDTKDSMQLENRSAEPGTSTTKVLQNRKLDHKSGSKSLSSSNGTGELNSETKHSKTQDRKVVAQSTAKKSSSDHSKKTSGDHGKVVVNPERSPNRSGKKSTFQKSELNKTRMIGKKWPSAHSSDQTGDTVHGREKKSWPDSNTSSESGGTSRAKRQDAKFSPSERNSRGSADRSRGGFAGIKKAELERNESRRSSSRDFRGEKTGERSSIKKKENSPSDLPSRVSDRSAKTEKRTEFNSRSSDKIREGSRKDSSGRRNLGNRAPAASQESSPSAKGRPGDKSSSLRPRRTPPSVKSKSHQHGVKPAGRAKAWLIDEDVDQKTSQENSNAQQPGIRIQKWLSQQGVASRREAEEWIAQGLVYVNGKLVTEQGQRIDPANDQVRVTGKHIHHAPPPRVYWLLHKPDMVLTSRPDGTGRASIYELESTRDLQFLISPVGRLDYRTEGLLLLSNDGELVHRLCHPKYKVPRMYNVLTDGRLSPEEERALRRGITLEDGPTGRSEILFAHGVNLGKSRGYWYFVTVFEGRNRLVRRMFEHFGLKVVRLVRYGFGDLRLPDDLPPGEYRQLTPAEIKYLKDTVGLSGEEA